MHRLRSERIPNTKLPCLSMELGQDSDTSMPDNMQNTANQESSLMYLEFLLRFHYVGMINWIIDSPPPRGQVYITGLKCPVL